MKKINLNCDVGEGLNNESLIMPYIQACNIACGGHAGTVEIMKHVVQLSISHKVAIGAHPSYLDKQNFGRITMNIPPNELIDVIREQVDLLNSIVIENNTRLHHIKPHGALYNDLMQNKNLVETFLEAVQDYKDTVCLFVPYGSIIAEQALNAGFRITYEAFADRNYNDDLSLVSRKNENAVLTDTNDVITHINTILSSNKVFTINGNLKPIKAETFCVHSDTPNALNILMALAEIS